LFIYARAIEVARVALEAREQKFVAWLAPKLGDVLLEFGKSPAQNPQTIEAVLEPFVSMANGSFDWDGNKDH